MCTGLVSYRTGQDGRREFETSELFCTGVFYNEILIGGDEQCFKGGYCDEHKCGRFVSESFQRIKEEEEERTGLILTGLHIYRLKKSMRICPSILSNPLMIFLWTTVVCNTLHYRNWSFIFPGGPGC
ncbi:hypothetical protein O5171_27150 [Escherichia coli]|nr:hypothetical protein [Escherichia coli]